jgi:formylmethanofuran dehydrogenase subunit C
MASSGTITRDNGSMTTSPVNSTPANAYNIIYTPGTNIYTGPEFSTNENVINDVTKYGPAVLTLNNNYTINGNLTLNEGAFHSGSTTLILKGDVISDAPSDMKNGQLIFDGISAISGSTSISAGNVEITSIADVTFPSGSINIAGNFNIIDGATFDHNNGTITLDGSTDQQIGVAGNIINNITINKTGGETTLINAFNLIGSLDFTSGSALTTGGYLTILSTSDGPDGNGRIGVLSGGANVSGDVTIQRYMGEKGQNTWRHISSFVTGATINDLLDDFTPLQSMYYYDETLGGSLNQRWIPVSEPSTPLNVGVGYIVAIPGSSNAITWDLTGPINQGNINYTVTYSGSSADDGWNHLGNPYPSTINWDISSGWNKSNISATVYVRDYASGIFRSWNGSVGNLGSGDIASGQAFFVVATGANPSISINENAKTSNTGTFYRTQHEVLSNLLEVVLSGREVEDKTYIKFQEDASNHFDLNYDGYKFDNDSMNLATILESGERMCINYLPIPTDNTMVNLDVYGIKSGSYTLGFNKIESFGQGHNPVFIDTYKKVEKYIRDLGSYRFEVDESDPLSYGSERFKILFQNSAGGFELGPERSELLLYPNPANDLVIIELKNPGIDEQTTITVRIYDVATNKLVRDDKMRKNGFNFQLNMDVSNYDNGMYLVVVWTNDKKYYSKFIKH